MGTSPTDEIVECQDRICAARERKLQVLREQGFHLPPAIQEVHLFDRREGTARHNSERDLALFREVAPLEPTLWEIHEVAGAVLVACYGCYWVDLIAFPKE